MDIVYALKDALEKSMKKKCVGELMILAILEIVISNITHAEIAHLVAITI